MKELLTCSIDKMASNEMSINYFVEDKELGVSMFNLLDRISNELQWELNVNLKTIDTIGPEKLFGEKKVPDVVDLYSSTVVLLGDKEKWYY